VSHPQLAVLPAEEVEEWQPHAPEEFQQVGLVGRIAIGLLGASTLTHLLSTWSDWNTFGVVHRYLSGMPNVDDADLNRADTISRITSIPNVIISVAAAVIFVIWLWRARVNSEVLCQADHRHSHGWVLASWFCPGPNLWYPKQIVDDVWLASDPRTPVWSDDLRRLKKPLLTSVWWCSWVGALAFDVVIRRFLMWMDPSVGSLRGIALAGTASLILTAISAVGAALVIRKVTAMQASRDWVPWWDQREPQLTSVPTYAGDEGEATQVHAAYRDADATVVVPAVRAERQPQLHLAAAAGSDTQWSSAPAARQNSAPGGHGGPDPQYSRPAEPEPEEEAPAWSPFAPVVDSRQERASAGETWQDRSGAETQQFRPYDAWRDEPGPAQEAPEVLQPSAGLEPSAPSWSPPASPYSPSEDPLETPLPRWQAETVAPPSLSQPPVERETPSWSESYGATQSSPAYLSPAAPVPAPEPAPAPAARPGRRAARVAVDSPSVIGGAAPEPVAGSFSESAGRGYRDQAPVVSGPPSPLPDDFLTPSKPLPPIPAFVPPPAHTPEPPAAQPTYSPEPSYTSQRFTQEPYQYSTEPTFTPAPTDDSSYESYSSEPSYNRYSGSSYQSQYSDEPASSHYTPEPSYTPEPYTGQPYTGQPSFVPEPPYAPQPSYAPPASYVPQPPQAPEPTYAPESSYSPEPYYAPEPPYSAEPSYAPEPSYTPEPAYVPQTRDDSSDYGYSGRSNSSASSYSSEPDYSYEAPAESKGSGQHDDDVENAAPRPHPRRRWV
jgi:hypothetical protein